MVGVEPSPGWGDFIVKLVLGEGADPSDRIVPPHILSSSDFCCQPSSIRPPIKRFFCFLFLLNGTSLSLVLSWQVGRQGWGRGI